MALYRAVIPRVARELVRVLSERGALTFQPEVADRVALAVAASIVETMSPRAAKRGGVELSPPDTSLPLIADNIVSALVAARHVDEVHAGDAELRQAAREVLEKYARLDEALDRKLRGSLTHLPEGTPEWERAFGSLLEQEFASCPQPSEPPPQKRP
jgi:hypothetical protein